jgi:hypothetical protein
MQKRKIISWLLCAGAFTVLAASSSRIVFRVLAWAGPAYGYGESTLMGATGASMATPFLASLLAAIPVSYIPKFKNIPGRYLLALGVLFFLFCSINALRIYSQASGS